MMKRMGVYVGEKGVVMQSWIIKILRSGADRTHFTDDMYDTGHLWY